MSIFTKKSTLYIGLFTSISPTICSEKSNPFSLKKLLLFCASTAFRSQAHSFDDRADGISNTQHFTIIPTITVSQGVSDTTGANLIAKAVQNQDLFAARLHASTYLSLKGDLDGMAKYNDNIHRADKRAEREERNGVPDSNKRRISRYKRASQMVINIHKNRR